MFEVNLPYSVLVSLPPKAFLHPRIFKTDFDTPESNQEQYEKGLEIGNNSDYVGVSQNGTWYAKSNDGMVTSYEEIGYHRSTAALLKGFLDSDAEVYVSRRDFGETRIK